MSLKKTEDYLQNQLIAYLGNKRKLLNLIWDSMQGPNFKEGDLFVDLFSGSGVVSRFAKTKDFKVWSNDWEYYSNIINKVFITQEYHPRFKFFGGHAKAIEYFNKLEPKIGWFSKHYSPSNDKKPNKKKERMFYTRKNATKIDAIREELDYLLKSKKITSKEFDYILSSLLYQSSYRSNTSGVFKGFHNGWGGKTSTALHRIKGILELQEPILYPTKLKHKVTRKDANIVAKTIKNAKFVYIDPPYNQHSYAANYHVLNTIALNDKPSEIPMYIKKGKKAAIREGWRKTRRSAYNYIQTAKKAFDSLLSNLDSEYILISYSTDGIITVKQLIEICCKYGKINIFQKQYNRYVVGNTKKSKRLKNVEFVIRISTKQKATSNCSKLWKKIIKNEKQLNSK